MLTIKTKKQLRQYIRYLRRNNRCIALIPTMGNLHDGHMALIQKAKNRDTIVIVSIFVNPMQFDYTEDLISYPRSLQEDCKKLEKYYVDFVFSPLEYEMYPEGTKKSTYVDLPLIPSICGKINRSGHFRGVLTIISKLFNLVQPDIAFFGEKDYQQLVLIRRMVNDMNYDIEIVGVPIVRDKDGLALSSRNRRLSPEERKIAPKLNMTINSMKKKLLYSKTNFREVTSFAKQDLTERGFYVENIRICDADTLSKPCNNSRKIVILVEAWLGRVLLLDNSVIEL